MNSTRKNSILWSFTVDDKSETSFLLGTMHVDTMFTQTVYSQVESIVGQCKYFYSEVDFSEMDQSSSLNRAYMASELFRLDNYLSSNRYSKLLSILVKAFHIDIDSLRHLKAMIIVNILAEQVLYKSSNKSLDAMLSDFAIENKILTGGIESLASQMELMAGFDEESHIKQLIAIGRNPAKFKRNVLGLNKYYIAQDIDGLYKSSKKGLGKLKHKLLYDRNKKMSHSIIEKAHLGKSFFAFGAGHLAGKYGILRYMKQQGIELNPLILQLDDSILKI